MKLKLSSSLHYFGHKVFWQDCSAPKVSESRRNFFLYFFQLFRFW